ncbi:MAG: benzil reductase ((S)-benzoin forming) [Candidatus Poriferisodalaceae bacterium]
MTTLAFITGTSRGIGAGIATAAESGGAIVAAINRSTTNADRELLVDLAQPESWQQSADWFDEVVDAVGPDRIVFVHNAATLTPIGFAGEVDQAGYQTNVLLNSAAPQVLGAAMIRTAQRVGVPTVVAQLSSGAGKNPYPGWTSYCASKAAVDMWVRAVGEEQASRAGLVRAVAISPGVVDTGMQAEIRGSAEDGFPQVARFQGLHAAGALGDPVLVGAQLWSAAAHGDWPNGSVLDVKDM